MGIIGKGIHGVPTTEPTFKVDTTNDIVIMTELNAVCFENQVVCFENKIVFLT